jgi:hypothetical protein
MRRLSDAVANNKTMSPAAANTSTRHTVNVGLGLGISSSGSQSRIAGFEEKDVV